ncbi:hypothetical protein Dsin_017698 [Dipteronia sinensis]|uniref:3-hydroxyisobutyryl-CoA hydrolase n=1 Tax=Dipteronia sinensis TaxID=43782 RepID=A0AAE0E6Z1_9ROSI|nr:hypothetical protein Dsin_017698 [Dipteronia sinensis]
MALPDLLERESTNQVVFDGNSFGKKVILNRPHKSNALTHQMISEMENRLEDYENDPQVKLVILKGNGKAFCAGGDNVAIYKFLTAVDNKSGDWSFGASYFNKLFALQYLVSTYKKPLVAILDGVVMGGGAAVSMLANFKIVTENTMQVFAVPEGALGSSIGDSYSLSRLPGYFGEYLGLTGAQIDGAEMIECGLATHFVFSKDLQPLENALDKVDSSDTSAISQLIGKFMHKPNIKQHSAYNRLPTVNKCFSRETVEDILLALKEEMGNGDDEKWIIDSINSMKSSSPLSLKVSLKLLRESRRHNLEESMILDYTVFCRILLRTVSNDVYEGMRAKFIEKGAKPKWQPSKLELVTKEMVDRCFNKLVNEKNLEFLKSPSRSKLVDNIVSSKL